MTHSKSVTEAVKSRRSIRAFSEKAVDPALIYDLLDTARWAPSGSNMQPWKVVVVAGPARDAVVELTRALLAAKSLGEEGAYPSVPAEIPEPYRSRRSDAAHERYEWIGVGREDRAGRDAVVAHNYDFWGAPVGLFFVIDRAMGYSQWAHLGMFIQSVALLAYERGLASCIQEAWGMARETLRRHLGLPESEMIYCGMALGYADRTARINAFRSKRAAVDEFAIFRGFTSDPPSGL